MTTNLTKPEYDPFSSYSMQSHRGLLCTDLAQSPDQQRSNVSMNIVPRCPLLCRHISDPRTVPAQHTEDCHSAYSATNRTWTCYWNQSLQWHIRLLSIDSLTVQR